MLRLSVKIVIPYKGLHLLLAIIPEEQYYNLLSSRMTMGNSAICTITKQRKGSDVDLTAVSARTVVMCMLILQMSLSVPSR